MIESCNFLVSSASKPFKPRSRISDLQFEKVHLLFKLEKFNFDLKQIKAFSNKMEDIKMSQVQIKLSQIV